MTRVWAVMLRDLLRLSRNPFTLVAAVLLPLVYLIVLGNALQGPITGLRVGLVVLDDGVEAAQFVGALQAVENGPRTFMLTRIDDPALGMAALRDGELSGLVVIPRNFSRDVERGEAAPTAVVVDNVDAIAAAAIEGAVQGAATAVDRPLVRFERPLGPPQVRSEEIYPRVDYDTSLVPGVVVLSVFMASMITGAFNLVMDRFLGVHEAYLATPLRRSDINLGVLGSGTLVGVVSSGLVLVVGMLLTGARIGGGARGALALGGVVVLTSLGMQAMMMLMLGRANHPRVAGMVNGFLNILLFFPSGALYPIQSFPGWLRAFAVVDPETHAVSALKAVLFRNGDVAAATRDALFLASFTGLMLLASTATLKRTL